MNFPRNLTPTSLQTAVLSLMLVLAPFAMIFTPYEGIYTEGVWHMQYRLDPLYHLRAGFIITGLIAGVISIGLLVYGLIRKSNEVLPRSAGNNKAGDVILQMSMALASVSIGWAAFPYWVNGVFQYYIANASDSVADFDPLALMPAVWMGGVWYLAAIFLSYVALFIAPFLFLLSLFFGITTGSWKRTFITFLCLAITAAVFFLSPNYTDWLGD